VVPLEWGAEGNLAVFFGTGRKSREEKRRGHGTTRWACLPDREGEGQKASRGGDKAGWEEIMVLTIRPAPRGGGGNSRVNWKTENLKRVADVKGGWPPGKKTQKKKK